MGKDLFQTGDFVQIAKSGEVYEIIKTDGYNALLLDCERHYKGTYPFNELLKVKPENITVKVIWITKR